MKRGIRRFGFAAFDVEHGFPACWMLFQILSLSFRGSTSATHPFPFASANVSTKLSNPVLLGYALKANLPPPHICSGINIAYVIENMISIPVNASKFRHPYGFRSRIDLVNLGSRNLFGWKIYVNFTRNELVTSVSNCKVERELPSEGLALTFESVSGQSDTLITAINAAGDVNQYTLFAELIGTAFFFNDSFSNAPLVSYSSALPSTLSLVDAPGYNCDVLNPVKLASNRMTVCCEEVEFPPPPADPTAVDEVHEADVEILYDILSLGNLEYTALVTIRNNQKFRRIPAPGWSLSWTWRANEIVWDMRGAETVSTGSCLDSYAYTVFKENIQSAHSCMSRPIISDLDVSSFYKSSYKESPDFTLLSCCKNGTLGATGFPPGDPFTKDLLGKSTISQFRMKVGTPMGGSQKIMMPVDFNIGLNGFKCGGAYRVASSKFPLTSGRVFEAYSSWKIDCNRTTSTHSTKSCCVSFSSYFNKTTVGSLEQPVVAACKTCACGCNATILNSDMTCPAKPKAPWAEYSPPCSDGCGFNVHWRVQDVYKGGWLAQIVVYNRGKNVVKDWFVAVTIPSFKNVSDIYSFQHANHSGSTMLMWGYEYSNDWLLGTTKSQKRMSNVQSIIKFGETDGFNISKNGGSQVYPTRVILNGEECIMPDFFPSYDATPPKRGFLDKYKLQLGVALAGSACLILAFFLAYH